MEDIAWELQKEEKMIDHIKINLYSFGNNLVVQTDGSVDIKDKDGSRRKAQNAKPKGD